jgi:hypothetical protein
MWPEFDEPTLLTMAAGSAILVPVMTFYLNSGIIIID